MKAILLDLDGAIFDIAERDAFARYQALNDLGYHVTLDDEKSIIALAKEQWKITFNAAPESYFQRHKGALEQSANMRVHGSCRKAMC